MRALPCKVFGPSKREILAEIERLTKLMSDPKLIDLELEPGASLRLGLEPCIGAKILAASFADLLGDAKNWRAVQVGPMPTENRLILGTARRLGGDTPEPSYGKACDLLAELRRVVTACNDRPHVLNLGIRSEETASNV
jgi:hypothetical protein